MADGKSKFIPRKGDKIKALMNEAYKLIWIDPMDPMNPDKRMGKMTGKSYN